MFVLFTYDVSADRTFVFRKLLRRYLGHEQASVFFGEMKHSTLEKLRGELRRKVEVGDRILEIFAENTHNVSVKSWSKEGSGTGVPQMLEDGRHKTESQVI